MYTTAPDVHREGSLESPLRNRYFYGKLLDVYHFELETNYFNAKRRLLNRLVSGYGVVCGLDVTRGTEPDQVVVGAGVALDKSGREIIVPSPTAPIVLPVRYDGNGATPQQTDMHAGHEPKDGPEGYPGHEPRYVHLVACYHECESDPTPVMTAECDEPCAPGAVRERYKIWVREGCAPPVRLECRIPDLTSDGQLDYGAIARWVTKCCPSPPDDPCIPLANIRLRGDHDKCHCTQEDIDISIRPIVYSNDLLFDLLICLLSDTPRFRGGKS
jgi:hypothetical protein